MQECTTPLIQYKGCISRENTMVKSCKLWLWLFLLVLTSLAMAKTSYPDLGSTIECLQKEGIQNYTTLASSSSSSFLQLLDFSLQNLRFADASVRKPAALIFPVSAEEVQKAFMCCCVKNAWEVRVRSGGHSYEGLSSTADFPFVIIDLSNLDYVDIDMEAQTAWVGGGATIGQIYYHISQQTPTLAFSAGVCNTVGCGGHISGGGYGFLSRKYGTSADNVIDAHIIDATGKLLDRQSMGEDLFWALRGGGGGSWGIVVAWEIQLVPVPRTLTYFNLQRNGKNEVSKLVHKWQTFAPSAPEGLFMSVNTAGQNRSGAIHTIATFFGQHLAPLNQTLALISTAFPELGITAGDCQEVSWIESVARMYYTSVTALPDRINNRKIRLKAKSDYVRSPLTVAALRRAFRFLEQNPKGYMIFEPYGGVMDNIPSNAIAFPHRAGNLYLIEYQVLWTEAGDIEANINMDWIRRLYSYMAPYVSSKPRAAYVNYVDLDLGSTSTKAIPSAKEAQIWGERYFLENFQRLVKIKRRVDPKNLFRNPQTI